MLYDSIVSSWKKRVLSLFNTGKQSTEFLGNEAIIRLPVDDRLFAKGVGDKLETTTGEILTIAVCS